MPQEPVLHQRLDPRRILKRGRDQVVRLRHGPLHQRLDPRRILKLTRSPTPWPPVAWLHQRLDPRRILKLLAVLRLDGVKEVTPEARSAEDTETSMSRSPSARVSSVTPEARSAEDTETDPGPISQPGPHRLHQRLDPRRILKLAPQVQRLAARRRYTRGSIRGGY